MRWVASEKCFFMFYSGCQKYCVYYHANLEIANILVWLLLRKWRDITDPRWFRHSVRRTACIPSLFLNHTGQKQPLCDPWLFDLLSSIGRQVCPEFFEVYKPYTEKQDLIVHSLWWLEIAVHICNVFLYKRWRPWPSLKLLNFGDITQMATVPVRKTCSSYKAHSCLATVRMILWAGFNLTLTLNRFFSNFLAVCATVSMQTEGQILRTPNVKFHSEI